MLPLLQWGVLPLCDNPRNGSHFYKISVYTGLRTGAGTKSNITFILTGDDADTGIRVLRDKKSRVSFCVAYRPNQYKQKQSSSEK